MGRTPVEDVQKSFSGKIDAHRYEEGSDKQAENQTEFPEETNLLLLAVLCLNHTQCDKTTKCATNWCVHPFGPPDAMLPSFWKSDVRSRSENVSF